MEPPKPGFPAVSANDPGESAQTLPSNASPAVGEGPDPALTIDRFSLIRPIGHGGMGDVFLATHPITGLEVALKRLKPDLVHDRQQVQRFLTEARHMYHLNHPHILRIMEVWDPPAGPYYVMPYMPRGSLADQVRRGQPSDYVFTLRVARDVAEALAYAHSKGIIHRDLKPLNVLMDAEGRAYLSDFGLVRAFNTHDPDLDVRKTATEGTAPYMSPAVAKGEAEDTRCDIYSFGAMLYELLTGRVPYNGASSSEVRQKVLAGPPEPILKHNPHAPPGLVKIAEGAMARELRDRYSSMKDVLADLERLDSAKAPLGPHGREKRRGPAKRWAIAVASLLVACSAVWWAVAHWRTVGLAETAPQGSMNRSQSAEQHAGGDPRGNAAQATRLAETGQGGQGTAAGMLPIDPALAGLPKEPGLVRTLEGHTSTSISRMSFLPGGRLVSFGNDSVVRVWDVAAGKQLHGFLVPNGMMPRWTDSGTMACGTSIFNLLDGRRICDIPGPPGACMGISPDGRQAVLRASDGSMTLFDAALDTRVPLFPPAKRATGSFSDNGRYFLYQADGDLRIHAADGWKPLATFHGAEHGFTHVWGSLSPDGGLVLVANDEANKASALVWDWHKGREKVLFSNGRYASTAFWSPDGRIVGVNDWASKSFFDSATGKPLFSGSSINSESGDFAFSPDGRRIICPGSHRTVVAEVANLGVGTALPGGDADASDRSLAVSADGRFLAVAVRSRRGPGVSGGTNGTPIHIYRLPEAPTPTSAPAASAPPAAAAPAAGPEPVHTIRLTPNQHVGRMDFLPDGRLLCGLLDHNVLVLDPATDKEIYRFPDGSKEWAWSPEAGIVACGGSVYSLPEGRLVAKIPGPICDVLAISPDGRRVVIRDDDGSIDQFDVPAQGRSRLFPAAAGVHVTVAANASAFLLQGPADLKVRSSDGSKLLGAWNAASHGFAKMTGVLRPDGGAVLITNDEEGNAAAMIWDFRSNTETQLFHGHRRAEYAAWSPDGKFVTALDWTSGIPIYDAATGNEVFHVDGISWGGNIAFSPDSRWAGIVYNHNRLRVIDMEAKKTAFEADPCKGIYNLFLAISRDGRFVAVPSYPAAGDQGPRVIQIWRLPDAAPAPK